MELGLPGPTLGFVSPQPLIVIAAIGWEGRQSAGRAGETKAKDFCYIKALGRYSKRREKEKEYVRKGSNLKSIRNTKEA